MPGASKGKQWWFRDSELTVCLLQATFSAEYLGERTWRVLQIHRRKSNSPLQDHKTPSGETTQWSLGCTGIRGRRDIQMTELPKPGSRWARHVEEGVWGEHRTPGPPPVTMPTPEANSGLALLPHALHDQIVRGDGNDATQAHVPTQSRALTLTLECQVFESVF